jgi:hypothetical protein
MLPPHPPQARRARQLSAPVRSTREKLAVMAALADAIAKRPAARTLRVLGRNPARATKPSLKVLKDVGHN